MPPTTSASASPSAAGTVAWARPARGSGWLSGLAVLSRAEAIGAWVIWAGMSVAALGFTATYALAMPYGYDEWSWVPFVTGTQPVTLSWLWSQHNEHRMVLPRLIYLGLGGLTGHDFRAGALFNVIALSVLAAVLMRTARALRGRTALGDAFFPLALLHWGQGENLLWGFQLNFVTAVLLAGLVLAEVARCGPRLRLRAAARITAWLVCLGLCGAFGLAYLPAMACWTALAGFLRRRDRDAHARRDGALLLLLAALPAALVGAYLLGYQRPPHHAAPPGLGASLRTGLEFLTCGIGPAAKEIWPASAGLILAVCAPLLWQGLRILREKPEERLRAAGCLCFLGGVLLLALGIGWGRAFLGPDAGFAPRYATLAVPLLCLAYLQCGGFAAGGARLPVQWALFGLMCLLVPVDVKKGLKFAEKLSQPTAALAADARAGVPPEILVLEHGSRLKLAPAWFYAGQLEQLREARLGPYRDRQVEGESHPGHARAAQPPDHTAHLQHTDRR